MTARPQAPRHEIDVAVNDGQTRLGRITGKRPKFRAFDAAGKVLGDFGSVALAANAIHASAGRVRP